VEGPNGETVIGVLVLFGPISNHGYCNGTLTVRYGSRRVTTQAAANFLKRAFGTQDASGNLTPLTAIDPSDLTGPQALLVL